MARGSETLAFDLELPHVAYTRLAKQAKERTRVTKSAIQANLEELRVLIVCPFMIRGRAVLLDCLLTL